jgi:hypothetical protein
VTERDPELSERLLGRLVDRFLGVAGLSATHREEALRQVRLDEGRTPQGRRILRATVPLGEGEVEVEGDGSSADADAIVDSMADTAGLNVVAERPIVGATGWEPQPDQP